MNLSGRVDIGELFMNVLKDVKTICCTIKIQKDELLCVSLSIVL